MNRDKIIKLIKKYEQGTCNSSEKKLLEQYLDSFQKEDLDWADNVIGDREETGRRIYSAILKNIKTGNNNLRYTKRRQGLLKIAASIVFFIAVSTIVFYLTGTFDRQRNEVAMNEKVTSAGQKSIITFYDGTTITLNANSKLRYPINLNDKTREVYLEGEAYFEITHNPEKPFIVHTDSFTLIDLGTEFDIKSFPTENDFTVSLVNGKVNINKNDANQSKSGIMLNPTEQYNYNKINQGEQISKFDQEQVAGWKNNILKFDDEPLNKVFEKLYRAYGIEFELQEKSFNNYLVTAKFRNVSFLTIINSIKKLTGLEYKTITRKSLITKVIYYKK